MILKFFLLTASLLAYGVGWLLLNLYRKFNYCMGEIILLPNGRESCFSDYSEYAWPLMHLGSFLLPIAALLFFSSKEVINIWFKKFAVWFIPLWIILIIIAEEHSNQVWPLVSSSNEMATGLGTIFLVVSALIIFFGNKKK